MPFAARLPPALTPRVRVLGEEPNFGIFFRGKVGRVTFPFLAERLTSLKPLQPAEVQAISHCLGRYLDAQLEAGRLSNLASLETLLEPLGLEDLPLESPVLTELVEWVPRVSAAEWITAGTDYRTQGEKTGLTFESKWHQTFIPNWIPDGLELAVAKHAMAFLRAENGWVKEHGIAPEVLQRLLRARETLVRLGSQSPVQRKRGMPSSLRPFLKLLEAARDISGRR